MSKHTKGPWIVDGEYVSRELGDEIGIAHILNVDEGGPKDWHRGQETEANARLIAAAPELLEALESIVNAGAWYRSALEIDVYDGYDGESLVASARAAIAKARGEA